MGHGDGGAPTVGTGGIGGETEREVFGLLRRADLTAVVDAVDRVAPGQRSLRLRLAAAEARVCIARGDLDELEHLQDGAVASGDPALVLRARAALADHHALRGNPVCVEIAALALATVGDGPLVDPEQLWARGRLRRTLALGLLFVPQDRPAASLALLDGAKADFSSAGFDAEALRSVADVHFVWFLAFAEDIERARDVVAECLTRLRPRGSSYTGLLLGYHMYLALFMGDLPEVYAGQAELGALARASGPRAQHPLAQVLGSYLDVACRLMGEGPTRPVLQAIDAHLDLVRAETPLVTTGQLVGLAAILIDLGYVCPGHLALARRWASQAMVGDPSTPQTAYDMAGLVARLDLLERADDAAVAAVDANIAAVEALGLRRDGAHRALRAALAARRAGRHDVADRLQEHAIAGLPPRDQRIFWEIALLTQIKRRRPRAPASPPGPRIRLLGPEVQIAVGPSGDGGGRPVRPSVARLVVALVAEGGTATADRLVDALWPDADTTTGRARLRVALHRLRRALGADGSDADDPVQRRGDLVGLAPSVQVDALEFDRLSRGDPADRATALALYQGDVAAVQLAYDEVATPLRRRLAARWRRLAVRAIEDVGTADTTIARIAEVLAGADHDLDPDLKVLADRVEARLSN